MSTGWAIAYWTLATLAGISLTAIGARITAITRHHRKEPQ